MQAYKQGILPPQHIFLTVAWYSNLWWTETEGLNCTANEMETVLSTSLGFLSSGFLDEIDDVDLATDTGLVCWSMHDQFHQIHESQEFFWLRVGNCVNDKYAERTRAYYSLACHQLQLATVCEDLYNNTHE
jgi:hypothetical protein